MVLWTLRTCAGPSPQLQEDQLQYCVERLVRGLGSNRKGARQGFSIALTEVLASFPQQVAPGEVLSLVEKHLQPSGSAKAEVRGRAACVHALVMACVDRITSLSTRRRGVAYLAKCVL